MNNEDKLLNLLQPKDYVSKIKLFCRDYKFEIKKYNDLFAELKNNQYISRIKIEEL